MNVVVYDRYGPPDTLRIVEQPDPHPGTGEMRVRVRAFTVTSEDCTFRRGSPWFSRLATGLFKPRNPVLGTEIAGVIDTLGEGVTEWREGDEVVADLGPGMGAYQEYVVLPEDGVIARRPTTLSLEVAVAIGGGFLTAIPFLREGAALKAGQSILINGAGGSVGSAAVQLAALFGAKVTAVVSTGSVDTVRELGAHEVVDYTRQKVSALTDRFDVIFDTAGKLRFADIRSRLTESGIFLSTVPSVPLLWQTMRANRSSGRRAKVLFTGLGKPADRRANLLELRDWVEEGQLRPLIDRHFTFADIRTAHAYVDPGHKKGNVIVTLGENA